MRVALFCHAEGDPLNENIQQELYRQYTQLEDYAHQNDFVIEYAVFHTGVFNFDQPDKTLLALIQRAQAKDLT